MLPAANGARRSRYPSTRTRRRPRSTRKAACSTGSTGRRPTSSVGRGDRLRGVHGRHRASSPPACRGRSRPAGRRSERSTSGLLRNFASGQDGARLRRRRGRAAGASRVYTWERQHQVDVAVAALPAGSDPGELARTDPDALRAAVVECEELPAVQARPHIRGGRPEDR